MDYTDGPVHPLFRFFKKRQSFEHEREVRAVFVALDEKPPEEAGKLVPTDVRALVEEIVVSPYAPNWVEEVARGVASRFKIRAPIRKSDLVAAAFRF